jgi:hypothetical protein
MPETFRLSEEVTRMLADSIVQKEVIEPMEKIGWSESATPPPPDYSGQPAGAEGAPAPARAVQPAASTGQPGSAAPAPASAKGEQTTTPLGLDLEQFRDPVTGKYLQKYNSPIEFIKGVGSVVDMAKTAFSENSALRAQLLELQGRLATSPATTPVATPQPPQAPAQLSTAPAPKSEKLATVLASLVENGGVLDEENMPALLDGLRDQARIEAMYAVEAREKEQKSAQDAEQKAWETVDEHMRVTHPDSLNFTNEMGLMVQSNPLLAAGVSTMIEKGQRKEATEMVWSLYQKTFLTPEARKDLENKEITLQAADAVRREAIDQARRDAGVMTSSTSGVHETPGGVGPSPEQISAAGQEMMATGLGARWREMTIGRLLTDPIFNR